MNPTLFVECCVLAGHRWIILRRDSAVPKERLVADAAGYAMQWGREESARAWAETRSYPVSDQPPVEVDLDAALRMCHRPETAPPVPRALWGAWDFLGRVGALEERPIDTHGVLDELNSRLSFAMVMAERPELRSSTAAALELGSSDLRLLADLLTQGTLALGPRLSPTGGLLD